MTLNFQVSLDLNVEDLHDSMQLPSGLLLASLETDDLTATLATHGDVRVLYGDTIYKDPDHFPDELRDWFANGQKGDLEVEVLNNNWFEVSVVENASGRVVYSDVDDTDDFSPLALFSSMLDLVEDCRKDLASATNSVLKFRILQLDSGKEENRPFVFDGWKNVKDRFDLARYDCVWEGELKDRPETPWANLTEVLDGLFQQFNLAHPAGYAGRSLSVSDVVEFPGLGQRFYCDHQGWAPIVKND